MEAPHSLHILCSIVHPRVIQKNGDADRSIFDDRINLLFLIASMIGFSAFIPHSLPSIPPGREACLPFRARAERVGSQSVPIEK